MGVGKWIKHNKRNQTKNATLEVQDVSMIALLRQGPDDQVLHEDLWGGLSPFTIT